MKDEDMSIAFASSLIISLSLSSPNSRAAEEAFIKERDEETPGQEWERIARLCDFNPKNNKNTKDVSRLRSILLHLKQTGLQRS